jgi:hypothetical protein
MLIQSKNIILPTVTFLMMMASGGVDIIKPIFLNLLSLLLLLTINTRVSKKSTLILGIIVTVIIANLIITKSVNIPTSYINILLYIFIGFFYINSFSSLDSFIDCLIKVLKIICVYTILSFFIQLIFSKNLVYIQEIDSVTFKNIFYFHWRTYGGFYRLQGIFWEPGILQIYMNLLVYLMIFYKEKSILSVSPVIFIIIFSFSTTGIFVLFILLAYKLIKLSNLKLSTIIFFPLYLALIFLFAQFALKNINDKVFGDSSGSFNGRSYDALVGIEIFNSNPFFGIGFDRDRYIQHASNSNLNFLLLSEDEKENRGSTNGLIDALAKGGLVFISLVLYLIYRLKFNFPNSSVLISVILFSLFSQPLLLTPFFISVLFWHQLPKLIDN